MSETSIKAEEWVIGCLLNDPENFERARLILSQDDFESPSHRKIFQAFQKLDSQGTPLDFTTLLGLIEAEEIKLSRFLRDDVPTDRALDHWIHLVKKMSLQRELKSETSKEEMDPKRVEAIACEINGLDNGVSLYRPIGAVPRFEDDPTLVIRTGFLDLDRNVKFARGRLLVISGRTGEGKTSAGLQIVHSISASKPAGIVSLEMTDSEIRQRLEDSFGKVPERNLFIASPPALSSLGLKHILKAMKSEQGVEAVVIDYLQLLREREDFRSRALEVSHIIRRMKEFCKELDLALIVISTLNRQVGEGERPCLGDLKESGDIEYGADFVLFIHQPEGEKFKVLIVAKNRWGVTGDIRLRWDGSRTKFSDYREQSALDQGVQGNLYEVRHDGEVTY